MNAILPRSPLQAILWETWRTTRTDLLIRVAGAVAFSSALYGIGKWTEGGPESWVILGILNTVLIIHATTSQAWLSRLSPSQSSVRPTWRWTQPIDGLSLVAVPLGFELTSAILIYVLPALVFGWMSAEGFHV